VTPTVLSQLARDLRAKVKRELFDRVDAPWMKAKELDIILEVLDRLAPARCLEWGAGMSTLYFPARMPQLVHWLSIEHHGDWFRTVVSRNHDPRVEVVHVPPDQGDYLNTRREGTLEDFRTYVTWPERHRERFDFVLVDGRARRHCLQVAFRLVEDRGVVVLHDANRAAYVEDLPPFQHQEHFTDWKTRGGGIWMGSKTRPLAEVLDVARHRELWRGHQRVAKVLFLR
jgi:predicted O-methyltransferase YrrM